MQIDAEQVTEALCYHGEGPVWSPAWGGLRWVDMLAGDLLTLRDGRVDRLHVGDVAAFVRPRAGGGYVVGLERGLGLAADVDGAPEPFLQLVGEGVRMNEGGCDPWGNLYAGSMRYDTAPGGGRLVRVDPQGDVRVVLDDVTISNGIAFSPDGSLAYYDDTPTGRTDVFDVVDRELVHRRVFHAGLQEDRPDGLTVDSAGNVWVAVNGAGLVRCHAPDGAVLAEVRVPVRLTTACTLGGPDLRDLFVTTSRENLEDPEPEAGAVFRARVEVPGLPVLPYGG